MTLDFLEKRIELDDNMAALALLGKNDEYLKLLCKNFSCQIVSRGDAIVIKGLSAEVLAVAEILEMMLSLYRRRMTITQQEVRYSIDLAKTGRAGLLYKLFTDTVMVTAKGRQIRPKTIGQCHYIEAIKKNYITLGVGPAGTGKTYLAVVMAAAALKNREVSRIILTRPAVEAGEKLGFLPGDLQDKVDPYLRPLYDALYDIFGVETCQKYLLKNVIEIAPLAYMRGRTLDEAFIILDEAQNTTAKQMKMFLTRFGAGSKMVVNGDLSQIDLPRGVVSGLWEAKQALQGVEGIACAEFSDGDVIRHDVVGRIIRAYAAYEAGLDAE